MNSQKAEKIFTLMKKYGVQHFKTLELEIKMGVETCLDEPSSKKASDILDEHDKSTYGSSGIEGQKLKKSKKAPAPQAAPPVESNIPHHVNEVANLLKLNDNDLVDKLFPDYTQDPPGGK